MHHQLLAFPQRPEGCAFCTLPSHCVRKCQTVQEYVRAGRALVIEDPLYLPNGQLVVSSSISVCLARCVSFVSLSRYASLSCGSVAEPLYASLSGHR